MTSALTRDFRSAEQTGAAYRGSPNLVTLVASPQPVPPRVEGYPEKRAIEAGPDLVLSARSVEPEAPRRRAPIPPGWSRSARTASLGPSVSGQPTARA